MNPYLQYMYSYPHKTAYRSLSGISLKEYAPLLSGTGHSLYLHIPFCQTKCGYCNLFSVVNQSIEAMDLYLDGVERQLRQYQEVFSPYHTEFSDFTIGGGTPLILTEKQLYRMFSMVESYLNFSPGRELMIETAPNQTTREKLELLRQAGATRISIGIQSFSDRELGQLKRCHSAKRAREAMELLCSFSFPCINMDFIYGIPGQTTASLLSSLKEALSFEPDELFLYPLYIKHGAGLIKAVQDGLVLNPERAFSQYQEASCFLRSKGYRQDSMRRFVRQGQPRTFSECGFGSSLALGCGGRSYLGNLHFCTPYGITHKSCLDELRKFQSTLDFTSITHGILLSDQELKRRYVIRHLLILPGLNPSRYQQLFGSQLLEDFPLLDEWVGKGFLEQKWENPKSESFLALTEKGMGLSDYLGPQLISPEILKKMEEWEVLHGQTYDFIPRQPEKL